MRYYEIIREGYKEVQQKYVSAGVDPESVEKTFNTYKSLIDRNQLSGNERNIDWWGKQPFDQFKAFVDEKSSEHSPTQLKRNKIPGKSINLDENDDWLIVIPLDKNASCFHGDNSDWCTAKRDQSYFEQYFYDREVILIYCLSKKTGGMWAIATHADTELEMFDQNDKPLTKEAFNSQTGLYVDTIVEEALKHQPAVSSSRDVYKEALVRIKILLNSDIVGRNAQIEKDLILTKNSDLCIDYMRNVGSNEDYPEIIQLIAVRKYGVYIKYIKNPTEKVQLVAVPQHEYAISYIIEKGITPSEKVKLAAVNSNGAAIQFIRNPSEEVQLAAVTKNAHAIQYIDNPSEQVQIAIVKQGLWAFEYIENPSEKVQLALITNFGYEAIQYITRKGITPSEKVQLAAVREDAIGAIKHIENPSEKVQLAAVTEDGLAIEYITRKGITPSEKVQLVAVTQNGWAIQGIENPSEAVKLAAVKQNGWNGNAIQHIKNPSEELQLAAVRTSRDAIKYIKKPTAAVKREAKY